MAWGFLGVLAFSLTLPLTSIAVESLDPLFVGAGRAVVAALLGAALLRATRQRSPSKGQWMRLGAVALGVVAGFPLLTSFAMDHVPASHGAVVVGLLPAATAVVSVVRTGERPSRMFWTASAAGVIAVVAFLLTSTGQFGGLVLADLLLLAAVLLAAIGYAEGGLLAREIGAWQTICWALVAALPLMAPLTLISVAAQWPTAWPAGWLSFAYVSLVSMFLGFFAWYRGLEIGPMTRISQIQLIQPVLTLAWSALLLGEILGLPTIVGAAAVVACAAAAVTARVRSRQRIAV